MSLFCNLPTEAKVPGMFTLNGRSFAAGAHLSEIFNGGLVTDRGSLGVAPVLPTQIVANETQLLIMNNGNLYVFTLATNVLTPVNMAQFGGPVAQIGFSDGFGIATLQNSHTFQQSNLEDFTTWNGLNIATISYFPDNITSFIADHRELWFFSGKKTLGYYNSSAGFPVFIPIQGAYIENGSGATFATVQLDNSVFWIDQDERGGRVARRLNGYSAARVSTHAVEFAWAQYPTIADAVAYSYEDQGHAFWVIYFPSAANGAGATWCFDAATNYWHKRAFWNSGSATFSAHRSMSHTFNFGLHLVGDWQSGNIYQLSSALNTDFGNPLRILRRSPAISQENDWVYFSKIEFDVETGLGPTPPLTDGDGQPRPPQLLLRWSDDAGRTWSNSYILNCGFTGEFGTRVYKRMLGRGRKRIFEVSGTDPVPWKFADAYIDADPELARV
jgi:hypothetical protein